MKILSCQPIKPNHSYPVFKMRQRPIQPKIVLKKPFPQPDDSKKLNIIA